MSLCVSNQTPPSPPRVHAPGGAAGQGGAVDAATSLVPATTGASATTPVARSGAEVTAVVPGAGAPPVAGPVPTPGPGADAPVPTTASPRTPPGTELARTGLDTGPLLLLALVLVLLGVLLSRSAALRTSR